MSPGSLQPLVGCDEFHDSDGGDVSRPVRSLWPTMALPSAPLLLQLPHVLSSPARERRAVRLRSGQDVVLFGVSPRPFDDLAFFGERSLLGKVVGAVQLRDGLGDDHALGVLPRPLRCGPCRLRRGALRAQVRAPRLAGPRRRPAASVWQYLSAPVEAAEVGALPAPVLVTKNVMLAGWPPPCRSGEGQQRGKAISYGSSRLLLEERQGVSSPRPSRSCTAQQPYKQTCRSPKKARSSRRGDTPEQARHPDRIAAGRHGVPCRRRQDVRNWSKSGADGSANRRPQRPPPASTRRRRRCRGISSHPTRLQRSGAHQHRRRGPALLLRQQVTPVSAGAGQGARRCAAERTSIW